MKTKGKILITDFKFVFAGYGHYLVYYNDPETGKTFKRLTDDMPLVDAVKNAESPDQDDLRRLMNFIKRNAQ